MKKFLIMSAAGLMALGMASAVSAHHAVNAQFDVDLSVSTGTAQR